MNKIVTLPLAAILVAAVSGCAGMNETKQAGVGLDALSAAAAMELKAAKKAGHVWRLIDKSTGKKSGNLGKLLKAGNKLANKGWGAYQGGNYDAAQAHFNEATRVYNKVIESAKSGQAQAAQQADAMPYYPN